MIEVVGVVAAVVLILYVVPLLTLHPLGRWWLKQWHDEGAAHQHMFYRCHTCRSVVTWRHIRKGGCRCGTYKISPAVLGPTEKAKLLLLPWSGR